MKTNTLYVTGLEPSIEEAKLRVEFAKHGSVERVTIIKDKVTREPKGFAYVLFSSDQDATAALKEMDGRIMADKPIKVKYSYSETPEWVSILENRGRGGGRGDAPRGGAMRGGPRGAPGRGGLLRGMPRGGGPRGMSRGTLRGSSRGGPNGRGGPIEIGGMRAMSGRQNESTRRGGPPMRGRGNFSSAVDGRPPYRRLPPDGFDEEPVMKRSRVDPGDSWGMARERDVTRDPYDARSLVRNTYSEDPYAPRSRREDLYPTKVREDYLFRNVARRDPYDERPLYRTVRDDYYEFPERRSMPEGGRPVSHTDGRRLLPPSSEGRRMTESRLSLRDLKPLMASSGNQLNDNMDRSDDRSYQLARKPISSQGYLANAYPTEQGSDTEAYSARGQDNYRVSEYGVARNGSAERYQGRTSYPEGSTRGRFPEGSIRGQARPTEGSSRYPQARGSASVYQQSSERSGGYVGYGEDHVEHDPYAELSKPAVTAQRKYQDYGSGY